MKWVITDAKASNDVRAESKATKVSYALGKHEWSVTGDKFACSGGQPYNTYLKLSGCNPKGDFTCNDGQCVTMEQRYNQIPNCRDGSGDKDCQLLIFTDPEGYKSNVPPIVPIPGHDDFDPTHVNVSIVLLRIVDMEETDHKIDFQFQITMEWRENKRVVFHNLKQDTSLNALSEASGIWLPVVIYDNTD